MIKIKYSVQQIHIFEFLWIEKSDINLFIVHLSSEMPVIIPALCVEVPDFRIYKFSHFKANICRMWGLFMIKTQLINRFDRLNLVMKNQAELSIGLEYSDLNSQRAPAVLTCGMLG